MHANYETINLTGLTPLYPECESLMQKLADRFCLALTKFSSRHVIWWEIIRNGINVLLVGVLAVLSYPFGDGHQPSWHESLKGIFESSGKFLLLCASLPTINFMLDLAVKRGLILIQPEDRGGLVITTIFSAINEFVGQKLKRFGECARRIESTKSKPKRAEVFDEITQPAAQIEQIITQIYLVVRNLTGDSTLKVVLVELPTGKELSTGATVVGYLPGDKPPSHDLTGNNWKESFFYAVACGKRSRHIADICKHMKSKRERLFFPSSADNDDNGSIIGFPINNPFLGRNTHVLTIRSDSPNVVGEAFRKSFEKYLSYFFTRIHVEYNLKIIKDAAI